MSSYPEESTAIACKLSIVELLDFLLDLKSLVGVHVGACTRAVRDTVAEDNLVWFFVKHVICQ